MFDLEQKVAAIIDPANFSMTPEHYGLTTQDEFTRTMAFGAQQVARRKAAEIIAVCAEEIAREVEAMLWYVEMTPGHIRAKEPADIAAAIRSMGEKGE